MTERMHGIKTEGGWPRFHALATLGRTIDDPEIVTFAASLDTATSSRGNTAT